jgi:hypothetical protein
MSPVRGRLSAPFRVCLCGTTLRNRGNDAWDVLALDTMPVQRENPVQHFAGRSRADTAEMEFQEFCRVRLVVQDDGFSAR